MFTQLYLPWGRLNVRYNDEHILFIRWDDDTVAAFDHEPSTSKALSRLRDWIDAYVKKQWPDPHDLPLLIDGTDYRRQVWHFLSTTKVGEQITYGDVARQLNPTQAKSNARAVGGACRDNRFSLVIPCHRVIAATPLGGGYIGRKHGLSLKKQLLDHERS